MATFVLVHGGWHGGWCWDRLAPILRGAGHDVLAPDLPGHGDDPTPASPELPGRYVPFLVALLRARPEPVVLAGHSSGGVIATEAARIVPEKVAALVYVAAFLLTPGVAPPEIMRDEDGSLLRSALVVDPIVGTTTIRPELAREVFYADCSDEIAAWATARLVPEPIVRPPAPAEATATPPAGDPAPAIPRFYVETLQDRALPPATQRRMYAALPCRRVFSLPTSHSPFLSAPDALAAILDEIARSAASPSSTSRAVRLTK